MQLSHLLLLLTLQLHHIPLPLPPPAGDSSCLLSGGQLQYARCCTFLLYFLRLRPRLPSGWKIITLEMGPQIQKNKSGIFLQKSIWFTLIHKWITPEFYTNFRRKTFQSRYYSSPTTWILFLSSATSQGHNRYILIGKKYIYILAINQIVSMCQNIFEKFMPEIRLFFLKVPMVVGGVMFSSVQSLNRVGLFATLWTAARQASLSITNCRRAPKPMSIESVMPSIHLILCRPLLLLPPTPPSIRVFSSESALHIR